MAIKDFDFKQFFLQKGEWVGLGVALAIVLPVLFVGLKNALLSPSPTANAEQVATLSKGADQKIATSVPPDDADKPPKEFFTEISFSKADPTPYLTEARWFIASSMEDTKRRN